MTTGTDVPTVAPAPFVLLADDNATTCRIITDYFAANGLQVVSVGDGESALMAIRAKPPELLLLDIQMPGLDGFGVLTALRADADPALRALPVIALTAMAMRGDEERCREAGASAYCSKPVRMHDLVQMVKTMLTTDGAASALRDPAV